MELLQGQAPEKCELLESSATRTHMKNLSSWPILWLNPGDSGVFDDHSTDLKFEK